MSCNFIHIKLLIKDLFSAEANMLFVESPVGVGFSYTNTSSDLDNLDDKFVGNSLSLTIRNLLITRL